MAESTESPSETNVRGAIEISLRLGVLFLLVAWCLMIIAPFVGMVAWAMIIAIAIDVPYEKLAKLMGGRRGLAASIVVVLALTVLIAPAVMLSETLVGGAQRFAASLSEGDFQIPPPPPKVAEWPIIGEPVYEIWQLANANLGEALSKLEPQLKAVSSWLLSAAGHAGIAMLQLAGSLFIAGVFLAHSHDRRRTMERFASRLAGPRGPELHKLAISTVSSVVQGIVGVAVVQSLLAAAGFMLAGVPAAGLWAMLVLIAAIVQLPVALVLLPPLLLVYSAQSTLVAVVFAAWCLFVSLIDNVLKPILFGRGVEVPTVVIFLGAIGGMLTMGIIGLFLGAVVLALGYELFVAWLADEDVPEPAT